MSDPTKSASISNSKNSSNGSGSGSGNGNSSNNSIKERRSARVLTHDPIVAPGYGTRKDLLRLSAALGLEVSLVEHIMRARGRGSAKDAPAAAAAPVANAWADFMADEGVSAAPASAQTSTAAAASKTEKRVYAFAAPPSSSKKAKRETFLVAQTGTLDSTLVGRSKVAGGQPYHLAVPTILDCDTEFTHVFSSCSSVHAVAIDGKGLAYGWGRNEASQLAQLSSPVAWPTQLPIEHHDNARAVQAATGKSHTLVLFDDGTVWAAGSNKAGQCGVKGAWETVQTFRKCHFDGEVNIVQISCGEDFSVALDDEGYLYSTGSSEFGQLGNGETGEYFITANKLGFANCSTFTKRTKFRHAPDEKLHGSANSKEKIIPLEEDVRLAHIACGRHHVVAIEAPSDQRQRVFTWGCGSYGCLGHGVQQDEYFPRMVGSLASQVNDAVSASAGGTCSLLRTEKGHVYYWGKHKTAAEAVMRPQLVDVLANNQHDVKFCSAGNLTVVCSTAHAQTVAWGQGLHGELGLADRKSSSKPSFVMTLDKVLVAGLACGYGQTFYLVTPKTAKDMNHVREADCGDLVG